MRTYANCVCVLGYKLPKLNASITMLPMEMHMHVSVISRSKGQSAIASAAYDSGDKLHDQRIDQTFDYSRKSGVLRDDAMICAPSAINLDKMPTRQELWNLAEKSETRKNSTVGREVEFSLPADLPPAERKAVAHAFGQYLSDRHGCYVDVNLHAPNAQNANWHCHSQMTTRRVNPDGTLGEKCRELDAAKTGADEVKAWRAQLAHQLNSALELHGCTERVEHQSFADRGLDMVPTVHVGNGPGAEARRAQNTAILESRQIDADLRALLSERAALAVQELISEVQQPEPVAPVVPVVGRDIAAAQPLTPEQIQTVKQEEAKAEAARPKSRPELIAERLRIQGQLVAADQIIEEGGRRRFTARPAREIEAAIAEVPQLKKSAQKAAETARRLAADRAALPWYRPFKKRELETGVDLARAHADALSAKLEAVQSIASLTSHERITEVVTEQRALKSELEIEEAHIEQQISALMAQEAQQVRQAAGVPSAHKSMESDDYAQKVAETRAWRKANPDWNKSKTADAAKKRDRSSTPGLG